MREPDDLSARKRDVRNRLKSRRSALAEDEIVTSSKRINQRIADLLGEVRRVGLYMPHNGEVRVAPASLANGADPRTFAWPITDQAGRALEFYIAAEMPTRRGAYGIAEPEPIDHLSPTDLDAILVPGVAFSRDGRRLGQGVGYYDRFLRRLRPDALRIGVCYAWQIVPSLPVEPHDVPMTHVVTEHDTFVAPRGADDLRTGNP